MISDADLRRESPEDVATVLAWELADRFDAFFASDPELRRHSALKGVSELAFKCVDNKLVAAEALASQMEAMAGYLRKNMA